MVHVDADCPELSIPEHFGGVPPSVSVPQHARPDRPQQVWVDVTQNAPTSQKRTQSESELQLGTQAPNPRPFAMLLSQVYPLVRPQSAATEQSCKQMAPASATPPAQMLVGSLHANGKLPQGSVQ
jgi:hypothetical protein